MKPAVRWTLLTALALGGAFYAWRNFPQAFSLVSLDLQMDRDGALAAADSLAVLHGWAPREGARSAAIFDVNRETQTFVELEGGGKAVFLALIAERRLAPWAWEVRRFRAGETGETRVRFTPDGQPWGFEERVPEDAPGTALDSAAARAIAERAAAEWRISLDEFVPVEAARVTRPSGRVDHTFVYQRTDAPVGEGRIRLRLVVSGDRVTELDPYLHVPEAFTRRYALMRSANEGISLASLIVALVVYGGLGIGLGLFVMHRRRTVLWKTPLAMGLVLGILQGGALASAIPLAWFAYDTAQPAEAFVLLQIGVVLVGVAFTVVQVGLSAAAAETLTRAAFPNHPQLWRLWSREAGASGPILSRTVLGYLLIGVFLAWAVGFARVSQEWQGWWSPTDLLLQPNLLATTFPWLGPIALSANAGFWEECVFRALPLAGAALLGDRYGRRKLWIGAAFVLQAVVFGAAHAAYAAQPAYARVVELILPSFLFGGVYLRWGLLPAVLLHFGYDLALTSIPLFVAETPGIGLSRGLVLAAGLLPLGIVVWRRLQAGRWHALPEALRNSGWTPPEHRGTEDTAGPSSPQRPAPPGLPRWLPALGVAGLLTWALVSDWAGPVAPLSVTRSEAVNLAREALAADLAPTPDWRVLPAIAGGGGPGSRFVWETAGDSTWRALLGDALPTPRWRVRFARFDGDVAERAEQWFVTVSADRRTSIEHRLPEARPGAALTEAEAREAADAALSRRAGLDPSGMVLVSIEPEQRPARVDWTVTFADTTLHLPEGEVRTEVMIAGDREVEFRRYVHVPEAWERAWRRSRTIPTALPLGAAILFVLIALGAGVAGVAQWARRGIDLRALGLTLVVVLPVGMMAWLNGWPSMTSQFLTTQPWAQQVAIALAGGALALGALVGCCAVIVASSLPVGPVKRHHRVYAVALGTLLAGVEALAGAVRGGPPRFRTPPLDELVPAFAAVDDVLLGFLVRLTLLLVILRLGNWLGRRFPGSSDGWWLMAGAIGMVAATGGGLPSLALAWAASAVAVLAFARSVPALGGGGLLVAVAVWTGLTVLAAGVITHPARLAGLAVGAALVLLFVRRLRPTS